MDLLHIAQGVAKIQAYVNSICISNQYGAPYLIPYSKHIGEIRLRKPHSPGDRESDYLTFQWIINNSILEVRVNAELYQLEVDNQIICYN